MASFFPFQNRIMLYVEPKRGLESSLGFAHFSLCPPSTHEHFTLKTNGSLLQDIPDYLDKCKFLPKLNNEKPSERNITYKERFSNLQTLVLIMVG